MRFFPDVSFVHIEWLLNKVFVESHIFLFIMVLNFQAATAHTNMYMFSQNMFSVPLH